MSQTPQHRFEPAAVLLSALTAWLVASTAYAEGGWYAGAGVTPGGVGLSTPFTSELRNEDDLYANNYAPNTGMRLFGGYRLDRSWALEAGYVDLGDGAALSDNDTQSAADSGSARGYTLSSTRLLPLNESVSLYGKIGVFHWNADTRTPLGGNTQGFDFTYGAGGQYGFGENFSLTAEWEHFLIDRQDVDLFSAGLRYQFQ